MKKKRILMVMTRNVSDSARFARERTISFIRESLELIADLTSFRVYSLLEERTFSRFVEFIWNIFSGLLHANPRPIQVALFSASSNIRIFLDTVESDQPDYIYFDGIRCLDYLLAARKAFPDKKLVCDLDDLMSHRMDLYRKARIGISAGYLKAHTPNWIQRYILKGIVGSAVQIYERISLRRAEKMALQVADAVVLVSSEDANILSSQIKENLKSKIKVIPPHIETHSPMRMPIKPLRFVFIGSDSLMQNYLSINYMLNIWDKLHPTTPLHIFGNMTRTYSDIPTGVHFEGFVESFDDVYTHRSIALCPSLIGGGIKSKILEAVSYGVIPVGNSLAFEGIGLTNNTLAMDPKGFENFLVKPTEYLPALEQTAHRLRKHCETMHASDRIHHLWQGVMNPLFSEEINQ